MYVTLVLLLGELFPQGIHYLKLSFLLIKIVATNNERAGIQEKPALFNILKLIIKKKKWSWKLKN